MEAPNKEDKQNLYIRYDVNPLKPVSKGQVKVSVDEWFV